MSGMSLKRAFGQISGLTFLSRILGFVRDICFAHFMGAGSAADAFLVAFKLPNLFRRLTAEGALTNAFLPVYTLAKETKGQPAALILAAEVQTASVTGINCNSGGDGIIHASDYRGFGARIYRHTRQVCSGHRFGTHYHALFTDDLAGGAMGSCIK